LLQQWGDTMAIRAEEIVSWQSRRVFITICLLPFRTAAAAAILCAGYKCT